MGWPAAVGVLVGAALLAAGDDAVAQRLYIGFEEGGPRAQTAKSSQTFLNHPTRCDTLLYPEGLTPPNDAACDAREATTSLTNSFDIGTGFGYGSTVGLTYGALRVELDFRLRSHGRDTRPIKVAGGDEALTGKKVEWAVAPVETLSDVRAEEAFLNLYYDFENRTRWTPYAGAGIGLAQVEAQLCGEFRPQTGAGVPGDRVRSRLAGGSEERGRGNRQPPGRRDQRLGPGVPVHRRARHEPGRGFWSGSRFAGAASGS